MNYLLDTCVLSEFTRHQPNPTVVEWLNSIAEEELFLSAITIGEIQRGIERLPQSNRKTELLIWMAEGLVERFRGRIVGMDTPTMILWGSLTARLDAAGKPMGVLDSLILAAAVQNNLVIVTRNVSDFLPAGVQVINPWD